VIIVAEKVGRGLDHLIEQNTTELEFLSAYGSGAIESEVDGNSLLDAVARFLKAGNVKTETSDNQITFSFGSAILTDKGLLIECEGKNLPLVDSDLIQVGFVEGTLSKDKSSVSVIMQNWDYEQRRFIERLVEYLN
jgi:DNA polymerase III sliding clamp (beta) subunit (PCNA family)